jgi:hypothetical protein
VFRLLEHTQILNILVGQQHQRQLLRFCARFDSCSVSLEYNDTVGCDGRKEGGAVAELCPKRVEVHGDVGEAIADDGQEKDSMANEPALIRRQ